MTVMIGERWQVTFAVQAVEAAQGAASAARASFPARRSWFAPPSVEEIAARCALRETLRRERAAWQRSAFEQMGGMAR